MPSPFPGMDPFIERQRWSSFHHSMLEVIAEALVPHVRPRYLIDIEERVYLEHAPKEPPPIPVPLRLPTPERCREPYLTIRDCATRNAVTIIEVISRTNKRAGSDGHVEYLCRRGTVLLSDAHLVELDLLRGGERLPAVVPLPPADYYAFVSRAIQRPRVDVYPWSVRQALPHIPVPLAKEERDVLLDLQAIFTTVYDRGGYDYALDYRADVDPPLSAADAAWVREHLSPAGPY